LRTPGQERAIAAFLAAHEGLVVGLVGRYMRRLSDEDGEELFASANAAAAQAFEDYQAGHESGASVLTLASRYIRAVLANHRRMQALPGAKARREEGSLSEVILEYDDGMTVLLGDTLEAPDELAALDGRLMLDSVAASEALSPRQRQALALRRDGVGLRRVGDALGISASGARDLIARTERSARRALGVAAVK